MLVVTIDCKQQTGYQTRKDLNHKAMTAPGNQVVNLEMSFPPREKVLYIPSELVRLCYLLS